MRDPEGYLTSPSTSNHEHHLQAPGITRPPGLGRRGGTGHPAPPAAGPPPRVESPASSVGPSETSSPRRAPGRAPLRQRSLFGPPSIALLCFPVPLIPPDDWPPHRWV